MSKVVYIASPYTKGSKENNVKKQIEAADLLRSYGFLPFWPLHSHYWHIECPHDWQYWMDMDMEWVDRCDILLRLPGKSNGADIEVARAVSSGKKVYFDITALIEREA